MYGQVTIADTATKVCGRGAPETILRNVGSVSCWVGDDADVTESTGMLVEAGDVMGFNGAGPIYAITAASTTTLAFFRAS